ncbi:MAG: biliverdin-producing heme oxygenase [Planctomycetota bacterium]
MAVTERTLSTRLKDDNWALHQIAEKTEGPGSLLKGTLPEDGYRTMLAQGWLMSRALDAGVAEALGAHPGLTSFVLPEQMYARHYEADLEHYGIETDSITPEPGCERYLAEIEANRGDHMFMLGLHYVRLGASNGNKFVAMKVRKTYGLPETGEGTRALDPFGPDQREKWQAFKSALDAHDFTPEQADRVFDGTRAAFEHAVCYHLDRHIPGDELLAQHAGSLDKEAFDKGHSVHVGAGK